MADFIIHNDDGSQTALHSNSNSVKVSGSSPRSSGSLYRSRLNSTTSFAPKIIAVLLLFILVCNLFFTLSGSDNKFTFERVLEICSKVKTMPLDTLKIVHFQITDDWGVFNIFRIFLNGFSDVLSMFVYVCASLVNLVAFIYQFVFYFILF